MTEILSKISMVSFVILIIGFAYLSVSNRQDVKPQSVTIEPIKDLNVKYIPDFMKYNTSKMGELAEDTGMLSQSLESIGNDILTTVQRCESIVEDFRRIVKKYDVVEEYAPDDLKRFCKIIHDLSHKIELRAQHDLLAGQLDDVDKIKIREFMAELRGLLAGISYCEDL